MTISWRFVTTGCLRLPSWELGIAARLGACVGVRSTCTRYLGRWRPLHNQSPKNEINPQLQVLLRCRLRPTLAETTGTYTRRARLRVTCVCRWACAMPCAAVVVARSWWHKYCVWCRCQQSFRANSHVTVIDGARHFFHPPFSTHPFLPTIEGAGCPEHSGQVRSKKAGTAGLPTSGRLLDLALSSEVCGGYSPVSSAAPKPARAKGGSSRQV